MNKSKINTIVKVLVICRKNKKAGQIAKVKYWYTIMVCVIWLFLLQKLMTMHKQKCVTNWDIDYYKLSFIQNFPISVNFKVIKFVMILYVNVVGEMYVVWYSIIHLTWF